MTDKLFLGPVSLSVNSASWNVDIDQLWVGFATQKGRYLCYRSPYPQHPPARPWEGGSKLLEGPTVPLGTVPTEGRVRQQPSTRLPLLRVPKALPGLWLLFACQHAGAGQPPCRLPTKASNAPWHQQLTPPLWALQLCLARVPGIPALPCQPGWLWAGHCLSAPSPISSTSRGSLESSDTMAVSQAWAE